MNTQPENNKDNKDNIDDLLQLQKRVEELEIQRRILTYENKRLKNENELLHIVRDEMVNLLGEEMTKFNKMSQSRLSR